MSKTDKREDYLKAIESRKSRRSYTKEPIDPEKVWFLKQCMEEINGESGLSIRWLEDGGAAFSMTKSYGMFKNVRSVMVLQGQRKASDLRERAGYYGERLVLEAARLGLGTCWVAGTYDKSSALLPVIDGEEIVCLISVGNVPPEQTLKEKVIYRSVHRSSLKPEDFYIADGPVPDWFMNGIKAVQKAPSAINSQKVRFQYKNQTATVTIPETRPTDLIDLGIAKLHFTIGAEGNFPFGNGAVFEKE
ncbi:MAG: hypothetical protein BGN88_02610 [Clostridiales bacterium 43-6]|nr:MAG: hypothetical protein BGN88_02610 [Clostridiales bacterium 43-6]